jgi:hypothetical protein
MHRRIVLAIAIALTCAFAATGAIGIYSLVASAYAETTTDGGGN